MNKNLTELVYIIDMSGSMSPLADDTIGGYNTLLKEQRDIGRENPDLKANVTTVLFDDRYMPLYERTPVEEVPDITEKEYMPLGMTAMHDAIGRTLAKMEQDMNAMPEDEKPGIVSVTIITDGQENASHEYTGHMVHVAIRRLKQQGWIFSFIGANIDVEGISAELGIDAKMSKRFTASKAGAASVFRSIAKGTTAMRGMSTASRSAMEEAMSEALDDIE